MKTKGIVFNMAFSVLIVLALSSCALKKPDFKKEQAKTYHSMGNFTSKHADYARAADLYKKAHELDPQNSKSLLALAKVQLLLGTQDEAIATYKKVLLQDNKNKKAKQGLATAYYSSGESMDAVEQWSTVLKAEPHNVNALNGLGLVLEQTHHSKAAELCFRAALKTAANDTMLLNNLGLNLAIQGSVVQGIKQLRIAYKINSNPRLKNNIDLLQSIANKEQTIDVLLAKLESSFPKPKTKLSKKENEQLAQYAEKLCSSAAA